MQWNFTGWIIGWHKTTGQIVTKYAMEGGHEANGIGGGIWMSGGGLVSDNPGRMFFATGNGYASQLADDPIPGRSPPTALEEAVVNMVIHDDGSLTPVDFFMPWEKRDLDAMDKDLGTSGFVLLDPATFSTGSVKRIGCVAGKTGKLYFLNLEDLGGYQMGLNRKDKVLQTVQMPAPVFSSAGSYPLEGGYVYITPVGKQLVAFKFGTTPEGQPIFTQAGVTEHAAAGRQGAGHGTVTSLNNQPGTGVVWVIDVEGTNIRAYGAIPINGVLPTLLMLNNPGQSKFSRPTFGDGRVYLTTTSGVITALGSPVNMPLNCSSPIEVGSVNMGNSTTAPVTCVAKIYTTLNSVNLDSVANFQLLNLPTMPLTLAKDATFSFAIQFKPVTVGPLSSTINLFTSNAADGTYSTNTSVVVRGTAKSLAPILNIQPNVLSFGEVVTGSNETVQLDFGIANDGEGPLTVQSYQWSTEDPAGPFITPTPDGSGVYTVGPFKFTGLPAIGGNILGNSQAITNVQFAPTVNGRYKLYLIVKSNGGTKNVGAFGIAGSAPKAVLEWKGADGKWIPYAGESVPFTFGNILLGTQQIYSLRLTNKGGTTLTTTISKPPVSGPLAALNGLGSIAEGSQLAPNASEVADLICAPPKGQVNQDPYQLNATWTMNNNDPTMGKQHIQFNCSGISWQLGPKRTDGQGKYRYGGCWKDVDPGRQMDVQIYYSKNNENGLCMNTCAAAGYIFAATEYEGECWCGNKRPKTKVADTFCEYLCTGNYTQYCGGDGAYLSLFGDGDRWNPDTPVSSSTVLSSTVLSSTVLPTGSATSTVVTSTTSASATPSTRASYVYLGCANEGGTGRALAKDGYVSAVMTQDSCQDYCTSKGYALSGTEFSTEVN